uniref:Putative secreted protein n=1 Tax=Ixodes ricinus TaxID=34613 RepID=A0A6B0V2I5_IXORI
MAWMRMSLVTLMAGRPLGWASTTSSNSCPSSVLPCGCASLLGSNLMVCETMHSTSAKGTVSCWTASVPSGIKTFLLRGQGRCSLTLGLASTRAHRDSLFSLGAVEERAPSRLALLSPACLTRTSLPEAMTLEAWGRASRCSQRAERTRSCSASRSSGSSEQRGQSADGSELSSCSRALLRFARLVLWLWLEFSRKESLIMSSTRL